MIIILIIVQEYLSFDKSAGCGSASRSEKEPSESEGVWLRCSDGEEAILPYRYLVETRISHKSLKKRGQGNLE